MIQRLVFFGTPDFAVPSLAALVAAGRAPVLVVTKPDRPAGRGRHRHSPPVAEWTRERGLPLAQPERVREESFLTSLRDLGPGIAVVVAFGQIFPRALLSLPERGCVNLHASLLPRWRGAAPIPAAIAAGDPITGVTTMQMEEGLDSGPILLQEQTPIGERETADQLFERLAQLGAELLLRTLEGLESGKTLPAPQDPALVTYAPRLEREGGRVDWRSNAHTLFRQLRALTPWPGLSAELRGKPVKLLWGEPLSSSAAPRWDQELAAASSPVTEPAAVPPGTFLGIVDEVLAVAAGEGTVFALARLQRPGRRAVSAREFANGEHLGVGERFG